MGVVGCRARIRDGIGQLGLWAVLLAHAIVEARVCNVCTYGGPQLHSHGLLAPHLHRTCPDTSHLPAHHYLYPPRDRGRGGGLLWVWVAPRVSLGVSSPLRHSRECKETRLGAKQSSVSCLQDSDDGRPQGAALCSRVEGRRPGTRRGGLAPPQRVSVPF